MSNFIAM